MRKKVNLCRSESRSTFEQWQCMSLISQPCSSCSAFTGRRVANDLLGSTNRQGQRRKGHLPLAHWEEYPNEAIARRRDNDAFTVFWMSNPLTGSQAGRFNAHGWVGPYEILG